MIRTNEIMESGLENTCSLDGRPLRQASSHPGQLSLAIPRCVGTTSTTYVGDMTNRWSTVYIRD